MAILKRIKKALLDFWAYAELRQRCLRLWLKCRLRQPLLYNNYALRKGAPIFVVGCGHSGTSLLLALLGAHSRICAIPEETKIAYNYLTDTVVLDQEAKTLTTYFDLLTISEGKYRWVEKTPKHIYSIRLLREQFPGCRFIIILRDGRDVAQSIEARYGSLRAGIQRWVEDNRAGEPYWRDADVRVVKYEDIVVDAAGTMVKLLEFLGENFEEQVLRSHEKPKYYYSKKLEKPPDATFAHHQQYRNWQINQKLFDGRGKWKQLPEDKKDIIKSVAGKMLIDYGYTTDTNW